MVEYVRGIIGKKSCKHGKYGLFEHLLQLFVLCLNVCNLVVVFCCCFFYSWR